MSPDKLVSMANQIGKFFTSQSPASAPANIADHLKKFWDPGMRAAIVSHLRGGGAGLEADVRLAVERLASEGAHGSARG